MRLYTLLFFYISLLLSKTVNAQSNGQPADASEIIKAIYHHDSIFWEAYNACDVEKMASYFTEDIEFYHDKGGPTFGLAKFKEAIRTGMCGKPDWRLRREVVAGTVKVFPMNNYGGLITGEHIFYINDGKKETLDGYGKFTQLWKFENGEWKMSRVLSYDHGPAPYINKRKEVQVSSAQLKQYIGKYTSPKAGEVTITSESNVLKIATVNLQLVVYAESQNKFFAKDRDLQFEFIGDKKKIVKMVVYEKGNVIEEAKRIEQ
ncbi:MAG TPA: DUF4440 domain-containing protein [Cyclobacteriaceae bacterium]